MKVIWRITPSISGATKNWSVERVEKHESHQTSRTFGAFKTLKAAKSIIVHLRRKPIELRG